MFKCIIKIYQQKKNYGKKPKPFIAIKMIPKDFIEKKKIHKDLNKKISKKNTVAEKMHINDCVQQTVSYCKRMLGKFYHAQCQETSCNSSSLDTEQQINIGAKIYLLLLINE